MPPGILYIVATPIGNLEDITYRAVRILKEVDLIAAEDTRHSRKLLTHFGIAKPLTSYYDHNQQLKGQQILMALSAGKHVALISDAGTPGISDPGYQLVREAVAAGVTVVPIPGPSAVVTALSACGLPTDSFTFIGFLPNRAGKRRERIASLRDESRVLIFYESPQRLAATLVDLAELLGSRPAVVARELTKIHEEFVRDALPLLADRYATLAVKGEVVILVGPPIEAPPPVTADDSAALLQRYLWVEGLSVKDAVQRVCFETGQPRSQVYAQALALKEKGETCS
jgi:16S rRNA (cytidine1402-2'-O)-methyltransferase